MKISLTDTGKRFNRDWIFRHFTYTFEQGQSYAIIGPNGSGKSTLLQALSGAIMINEGVVQWTEANKQLTTDSRQNLSGIRHPASGNIASENIYQYVSICAPYLEVIEEMTLKEFLAFHASFKPLLDGADIPGIIQTIGLSGAADKQIRNYSSGMKQRVRLAQAIFSNVPIVLLDEPCTSLDEAGIALYQHLIDKYCNNRLLVVSSNDEVEYRFCQHRVQITDYKK